MSGSGNVYRREYVSGSRIIPYPTGRISVSHGSQAINCLATFITSLRDKGRNRDRYWTFEPPVLRPSQDTDERELIPTVTLVTDISTSVTLPDRALCSESIRCRLNSARHP